ncbi:MAG: hypothetical protein M4579_007566, partial [Chaenotheca gracillima]
EVVLNSAAIDELKGQGGGPQAAVRAVQEIDLWKKGTLETVSLTGENDFVALKFSGAGSQALYDLSRNVSPAPILEDAITEICDHAAKRGVCLLFDAEQQVIQAGIDSWALEYMRRYNTNRSARRAVIYNTYQAYLKATPSILSQHLSIARKDGFTLGVKLVRGAYLGSDPRHLINDTKEQTDQTYDGISDGLIQRSHNSVLRPTPGESEDFPRVSVVLASHNRTTVRAAQALREAQAQKTNGNTENTIDLVYAQLQGMADDVSCELVQARRLASDMPTGTDKQQGVYLPSAYKYL